MGGRSLRSLLSLDTSLENLSFWIAIVRGNSTLECKLKQVSEMFCVFLRMINQCLWASGLLRERGKGREICFLTPRKRIVKNITWQTVDFAAPVSSQMPGFEWDHLQALGGMAPRRITSGATRGKASAARFGSLVDAFRFSSVMAAYFSISEASRLGKCAGTQWQHSSASSTIFMASFLWNHSWQRGTHIFIVAQWSEYSWNKRWFSFLQASCFPGGYITSQEEAGVRKLGSPLMLLKIGQSAVSAAPG